MKCVGILLLVHFVTAQNPSNTDTLPTMEMLDDDHVMVEYEKSFVIPNFSEIKSISVYLGGKIKNIAVATRENITNALNSRSKTFQKLEKKTKLKGTMNPCEANNFSVRITFPGEPGYLDSLEGSYVPNKIISDVLKSNICVDGNSLMLPLEKMMDNSALLSRCLGELHTQPSSSSKIQLRDGLNSLGSVSGNFTIIIENKHTGQEFSLKLDKRENQCPSQPSKLTVFVGIALIVFVIVACSCLGCVCSGLGFVLKNNMKNNSFAQEINLHRGVEDGDIDTDDCEKKFIY